MHWMTERWKDWKTEGKKDGRTERQKERKIEELKDRKKDGRIESNHLEGKLKPMTDKVANQKNISSLIFTIIIYRNADLSPGSHYIPKTQLIFEFK